MEILKGGYAGKTARLHQFANDWIMADIDGGRQGVIVKPTSVRLSDDEYWRMRESQIAYQQRGDRSCGTFWAEWEMLSDGTFKVAGPGR